MTRLYLTIVQFPNSLSKKEHCLVAKNATRQCGGWSLLFDQAAFHGITGQIRIGLHLHLFHYAIAVCVDSAQADR